MGIHICLILREYNGRDKFFQAQNEISIQIYPVIQANTFRPRFKKQQQQKKDLETMFSVPETNKHKASLVISIKFTPVKKL